MSEQIIQEVWVYARLREDKIGAAIGGEDGVTKIELRHDNLGTYGISWFDVYVGDDLIASFNATDIAHVVYLAPLKAGVLDVPIERLAKLLWERFAPEHEVDWPPFDADEYRSVATDISALYLQANKGQSK